MPNRSLRVFPANLSDQRRERELDQIAGLAKPKSVSVPLAKIVPWLMEATSKNHAWLSDFSDDCVSIDSDLYDVLMAYQTLQSSDAA